MLLSTIEIMIQGSNTVEELQECETLIKDKKRAIRKMLFSMAEQSVAQPFLKDSTVEEAMLNILAQPEDFKLKFAKELSDSEKVETLLEEAEVLLNKTHDKMRTIIWAKD